jgi:invasion protein IalB
MVFRSLSGPGEAVRSVFVAAVAVAGAMIFVACPADAQQPAQNPAAPRPATPARPPAAAPKPPAPAAQQPAPAPQAAPPQGEMPKLVYSPWLKFCDKPNTPNAKQVCFTGRDVRTEAGQPVAAVALVEPEGEPKKLFRVTLPAPLLLQYGTRIVVDQEAPIAAPFFTCFASACMADYEGTPELIGKLKKGQTLFMQAVSLANSAVSLPMPLTEASGISFQKANEGPPADPKLLKEQQEQLDKARGKQP